MASKDEDAPVDMKSIVRDAVLQSIHAATESGSGWLVAVLDKHATRVISSVVSMFDIMEQRITLVESLEKKRQPFPEMDVIYFLSPCEESIDTLAKDFKKKPCYANAHLFFLSKVSDDIMGHIQQSPALVARIKTFKEMNIDFLSTEASVFHLDENHAQCCAELYSDNHVTFAKRIAHKLATVCYSLNECPVIRCRRDSPMEAVAMLLVSHLNEMKASTGWWYHGMQGHTDRPQGVLLLLDRSEDLVTPALHSCDYESLVNDLLTTKDNVLSLKDKGKVTQALLSEKDELWVKFKTLHIADVSEGLTEYLNNIKKNNPQACKLANNEAGETSITDLTKMIKAMPEYNAQLDLYGRHHKIAQQCMAIIQARNNNLLNMVNDIEQTLATGFDMEPRRLKLSSLIEEMMDYLMSDDTSLKLRLVIILVASQRDKLSSADLDRVCTAAGFGATERAVLTSVQTLSATPSTGAAAAATDTVAKKKWFPSTMFTGSSSAAGSAATPPEFKYPSARYTVPLKALISDLMNGTLSQEGYPSPPGQEELAVSNKPAAQSTRKNQGWSSKKPAFVGGRNIIFMAGGLTRAEMHAGAALSESTNKEVIMGGTNIINPEEYLNGLRAISSATP